MLFDEVCDLSRVLVDEFDGRWCEIIIQQQKTRFSATPSAPIYIDRCWAAIESPATKERLYGSSDDNQVSS
jgi:hypothetical protein